jgi:hypothetical protein
MDLNSVVATYKSIAEFGFPFILFLLLFGSYLDIWRWGKSVRAREEEFKAAILKQETVIAAQDLRIDQMFERLLEAAGLIEKTARRQVPR